MFPRWASWTVGGRARSVESPAALASMTRSPTASATTAAMSASVPHSPTMRSSSRSAQPHSARTGPAVLPAVATTVTDRTAGNRSTSPGSASGDDTHATTPAAPSPRHQRTVRGDQPAPARLLSGWAGRHMRRNTARHHCLPSTVSHAPGPTHSSRRRRRGRATSASHRATHTDPPLHTSGPCASETASSRHAARRGASDKAVAAVRTMSCHDAPHPAGTIVMRLATATRRRGTGPARRGGTRSRVGSTAEAARHHASRYRRTSASGKKLATVAAALSGMRFIFADTETR